MEKKNKVVLGMIAGLMLLSSVMAFSQESMTDDEFVNVSKKKKDMDSFLGFRLGLTKDIKNEADLKVAPGVALGYNIYLQQITDSLSIGPAVRASAGFITEVEVPVYSWSGSLMTQVPGKSQKIGWGNNAILLNIDGLVGYGLKFKANDLLNVVAKAGISINADTANYSYTFWGSNQKLAITTGSAIMGLGLDAGVQINPVKTLPLYIELGAGFSFDFLGYLFTTIDIQDSEGKSIGGSYPKTDTGNFEPQSFISVGAPYLVIGYRF
jgi:hypothetical protein